MRSLTKLAIGAALTALLSGSSVQAATHGSVTAPAQWGSDISIKASAGYRYYRHSHRHRDYGGCNWDSCLYRGYVFEDDGPYGDYYGYAGVYGYPRFYGIPYDDRYGYYGRYPYRSYGGYWRPHAGFWIGY